MSHDGWFFRKKGFEDYRLYVLEKIERDFNKKICYPEYRKLARPRYDALKELFTIKDKDECL